MEIKSFLIDQTNCYIIWDETTLEGAVIDPADSSVLPFIAENRLKIKYVILTHCHFDHIGGVSKIADSCGAEIAIHKADAVGLTDNRYNLGSMFGGDFIQGEADMLLTDGDVLRLGNISLKILHTPGHTAGGIGILADDTVLFSGDTLFCRSIGRSDFPGGNHTVLINSIKTKLLPLGDSVTVYPGHDRPTTIGEEKRFNPYLIP